MSLLIALLVLALIAYFGFWVIAKMELEAPIGMIARVIFGLIILLVLLNQLGFAGHPLITIR